MLMIDDVKKNNKKHRATINAGAPKPSPDTDSFLTPEQMAALDEAEQKVPIDSEIPVPKKTKKKFNLRMPKNKKEWAITILVALLLIVGGFFAWQKFIKKTPISLPHHSAKKSNLVPSTLSGLPVDPSVNKRPVTGVMIENSMDARPQSGLGEASVVFEAIAEGGITRFLALFQDTAPENIGPIRSARPYYAQWVLGFDAGYAHVGGSPQALADIRNWNVRDLDQFANGGSYRRVSERPAPHNVYTSMSALNKLEDSKGWGTSQFKGFVRKPQSAAKIPTAKSINFAISGPIYNSHYDYDAKTNSYLRSEGGQAQTDANTSKQINPKVVIGLIMPYSIESDGIHSVYDTIGTGQAYVFQDGKFSIGSWTKNSNEEQFTFQDASGNPLKLNAGKTWLTALRSPGQVTYTP